MAANADLAGKEKKKIATVATLILFLTLLLPAPAASLGDGGKVHDSALSPGIEESRKETVSGAVELSPDASDDWWATVWASPMLTVLASSERYYAQSNRQPKQVLDWARQMVFQLRRWLPQRDLVWVADSAYAALDFLSACQSLANPVTVVTRLRLAGAVTLPTVYPTGASTASRRNPGPRRKT